MSGLYLNNRNEIIEYHQGEDDAFNITAGSVVPLSALRHCELLEPLPEAA